MKIFFAGIQLTDWQDYPAQQTQLNGEAVYDVADVLNAATKKLFFRGNELVTLQFSARKEFTTLADAQVYFLTFYSALPKTGTCQIVCGGPGDVSPPSVFMENAILAAVPQINFAGVEVVARFTVVAPLAYAVIGGIRTDTGDVVTVTDYALISPAAAGNTNVAATPDLISVKIEPAAGGGAYTRTIALLAPPDNGSERDIYIEIPASTNPTVEIRDQTAGGTLLHTETGVAGGITHVAGRCKWNGSNWVKWGPWTKQII